MPKVCGDHKAVKMEDCDEADSDKNDGCTPSCQLEFCPRKALRFRALGFRV